jgi:hypothetical protein
MSWTRYFQPAIAACLLISSFVGAEAFQVTGKKKATVAPAVGETVATERSGVAFGYGGKLGPKDRRINNCLHNGPIDSRRSTSWKLVLRHLLMLRS